MSHRQDRLSSFIREVVSDAIANHVSDPRVHRLTSVTRVELTVDLSIADVHVSVIGTRAEADTTIKGLTSARGMIQTRLARQLDIRRCPVIRFHLDRGFKQATETIRRISVLQDQARGAQAAESPSGEPPSDLEEAP